MKWTKRELVLIAIIVMSATYGFWMEQKYWALYQEHKQWLDNAVPIQPIVEP